MWEDVGSRAQQELARWGVRSARQWDHLRGIWQAHITSDEETAEQFRRALAAC